MLRKQSKLMLDYVFKRNRAVIYSTPMPDDIRRSLEENVTTLRRIVIDRESIRMEATRLYIDGFCKRIGERAAHEEAAWDYLIRRLGRLQADIELHARAQTRAIDDLTVSSNLFNCRTILKMACYYL